MGCFRCIWRHSTASQTVAGSYCVTVGRVSAVTCFLCTAVPLFFFHDFFLCLLTELFFSVIVVCRSGQFCLTPSTAHSVNFDINTTDDFGRTFLHAAAYGG